MARQSSDLPRPAAFLDRDGVINIDSGYPHRIDDLVFTPTAANAIRRLNAASYWTIVVTNQSGVARGMFTLEDVDIFHAEMQRRLAVHGAAIDAFYVAPYHPDGVVLDFAIEHDDRKPGAGLLFRAMRDRPVDRDRSFLIGDRESDLEAARRAGIRGVLVPSNRCDLDATVARFLDPELDRRELQC